VKVARYRDRLAAAGATAVFVVHDDPAAVRATMLAGVDAPFPIGVDLERRAYRAWGLRRAPWWRIWLDPQVYVRYARLLARGERLRRGGRDLLQLGGDFVVAGDGRVAYARPQERDDRPPVLELLRAVEEAA